MNLESHHSSIPALFFLDFNSVTPFHAQFIRSNSKLHFNQFKYHFLFRVLMARDNITKNFNQKYYFFEDAATNRY